MVPTPFERKLAIIAMQAAWFRGYFERQAAQINPIAEND